MGKKIKLRPYQRGVYQSVHPAELIYLSGKNLGRSKSRGVPFHLIAGVVEKR